MERETQIAWFAAAAAFMLVTAGCQTHNKPLAEHAESQTVTPDATPLPAAPSPEIPPTQVTTNVTRATFATEGADFDPCISRDGTHLVFASTQHRPTSDIYIKRTDSRVMTQLTNDPADDAMPAISPDGTKIAFASNRSGNWDIFVMPITGGKAVQITSDAADEMHPSWSPDGSSLVYSRSGSGGRWEMWVSKAGNDATANFIGYGVQPKWCPIAAAGENGSEKILFQVGRERGHRSYGLWTLDYANGATSNVTEIAGGSNVALLNATWSPDGRWISFAQAEVGDTAGSPDRPSHTSLWIASVAGEGRVQLTLGDGLSLSPTWSSKNTLYFVSDRSGIENIWSIGLGQAVAAAQASMETGDRAVASEKPEKQPAETPAMPEAATASVPEATDPAEHH
jgi:Tol biopolymer transport system component